jgi:RNA-directed DNA polymerase
MVRYADDFVCVFQSKRCAQEFYESLQRRLGKYKLEVEPSKTKLLLFNKYLVDDSGSFTFLSFDFYMDRNSKGKPQVKMVTSRKKLQNTLQEFTEWAKESRKSCITKLMKTLKRKYRGYYNYYGVHLNSHRLSIYYKQTQKILYKWLNRRSQRKSYNWKGFNELFKYFEIPWPTITVRGMKRQRRNIW